VNVPIKQIKNLLTYFIYFKIELGRVRVVLKLLLN